MLDDNLLFPLALVAAYLGFRNLEQARNRVNPMAFFTALMGWWALVHFYPDFFPINKERWLVSSAFLFLGLSPFFGFVLFWENGRIIKGIFRLFLSFLVGLTGVACYWLFWDESRQAALAFGGFFLLICLLPYGFFGKVLRKFRQRRALARAEQANFEQQRLADFRLQEKNQEYRDMLELAIQELQK